MMKSRIPLLALIATGMLVAASAALKAPTGTWCIDREGLIISFRTKDSLTVRSSSDETVNGDGTYSVKDSIVAATVANGDVVIRLSYQFRWKNDSTIMARPVFFAVNADTIAKPDSLMIMKRCAMPKAKTSTATGTKGRKAK